MSFLCWSIIILNMQVTQKSINSILIANRGEIASRIIRTCRKMGIRAVAVFSEADRYAPFVGEADLALCIGENSPNASYLNQELLINLCQTHQIDTLHPGYGFLSENAEFAQKCQAAGIIFIGPSPESIAQMGIKSKAKSLAQAHQVPTLPGYWGEAQALEILKQEAEKIGFPLLVKASAGGGGKGMRIVRQAQDLEKALSAAKSEAQNAFGNDELMLEKYIEVGRHIEFQIFGDKYGNAVHLFERECTIQRRYQKIIEESPSPALSAEKREAMAQAALRIANALNYENAGTVEFIYDTKTQDFYFLEVNTRLQVEHPVTEAITGLDLVQLQIEVAEGKAIPYTQDKLQAKGYALECRLYAEDAQHDFRPATGKIAYWQIPEVAHLRVDAAVESGSEISMYYDPMIAKIIIWGEDRPTAHRKMRYTLENLVCLGITTNQNFLTALLNNEDFKEGNYDTHFLATHPNLTNQLLKEASLQKALIAATLHQWQLRQTKRTLLRHLPSGWRNSFYAPQEVDYAFGATPYKVKYRYLDAQQFIFDIAEAQCKVRLLATSKNNLAFEWEGMRYEYNLAQVGNAYYLHHPQVGNIHLSQLPRLPEKETEKIQGVYQAPMPSQVVKVCVEVGQQVRQGDSLIVLSSMKMENTLSAQADGTVTAIYAQAGESVEAGFLLIQLSE